MDVDQAAEAMRDEEWRPRSSTSSKGFNQPTYGGMRVDRVRVHTWSSQRGMSGL
jgi:hypothetical protein